MANRLGMAAVCAIGSLWSQGWSIRRIARELGVDRGTVSRYVRRHQGKAAEANAANAPPGSDGVHEGEGRGAGRRSDCEPYRALITAKLDEGLSAQRIFQDLRFDHGFGGSYYSVRRFLRRLGACSTPLPFRRIERAAGEEAQVDFGAGAPIVRDGRRGRSHVFRIVLSYSRKAYSEAVSRQTTEDFLRCVENAIWHFGGAPRVLVIDNLRAAVAHPDWFDPELTPKVQSFCAHYGVVILPTKPRTPRHKGKVERSIGYVKDNALRRRTFTSLEEQNRHLASWEVQVADRRIHGTTRQQVGRVFAEVERPHLQALPAERFPFFHEARRQVHRDGHIELERAYYSVPPEYVGRPVWVRWDARTVRIFNSRMQQLALHCRAERGAFRTDRLHLADAKISAVEHSAAGLLVKARCVGPETGRWSEAMLQARGIEGVRVLLGLLALAKKHPADQIDRACAIAVSYGAFRLRTVRQLIGRLAPSQAPLEFLDEHPIIRSMSDYGELVRSAIHKETCP